MSNPTKLVECVPNFSEGRDTETLDAILEAIESVPGVWVLDRHIDKDHNRSVVSFVGEPVAVRDAAIEMADVALRLIDISPHQGVHPRIGAIDVLPFIPYRGIGVEETVALAREAAQRIADTHGLPIYFYGAAASTDRRPAVVRNNPDQPPDLGPDQPHPTGGATLVGVRPFLIAYNVVLDTSELSVAHRIAKEVRASSGGLPGLQALGFALESRGKVQVSMNLIDLEAIGLPEAYRAVVARAEAAGVSVIEDELVGLAPATAINEAAGFPTGSLIEERLLDQLLDPGTCSLPLLERLSSGDATPGGGAVVALAAAMAAAQISMLCRLSNKPLETILAFSDNSWRALYGLIQLDQRAFSGLLRAYRLPKQDPERHLAIQAGQQASSKPPLEVMRHIQSLLACLGPLAESASQHVLPDLGIAVRAGLAALEGAADLVRINLAGCEKLEWAATRKAEATDLLSRGRISAAELLDAVESGMP